MKKFLALCLSLLMVFSIVPISFADEIVTIPATGEVYIEAENYMSVNVYATEETTEPEVVELSSSTIKSDSSYHGGARVHGGAYGNYKAEINIPFSVEASGTYYVSFRTIAEHVHRVYQPTLSLNGTPLMIVPASSGETWVTMEFPVTLEANDDNTLTFTGYSAEYNDNLYLFWDYIRISDTRESTAVSEEGTTTIQVEEFPVLTAERIVEEASVTELYSTNGDGYGSIDSILKVGDAVNVENLYWYKDITIPKDGLYTIDFNMIGSGNYTSTVSAFIDSTKITLSNSSVDTCASSIVTMPLTAGTHTLTINTQEAPWKAGNNRFYADYVSITPAIQEVLISETEETIIQAENYNQATRYTNSTEETTFVSGNVVTDADDESVTYLTFTDQVTGGHIQTWSIPVEVTKEAMYKISYRLKDSNEYEGYVSTLLNGDTLQSIGEKEGAWNTYSYYVNLPVGENTIGVSSHRSTGVNAKISIDYISITPAVVKTSGVTQIEAEDYPYVDYYTDDVLTSEKNKITPNYNSTYDATVVKATANCDAGASTVWSFKINVETEGWYDISYRTILNGVYTSNIYVGANGNYSIIGDRDSGGNGETSLTTTTVSTYLDEGENEISVKAVKQGAQCILTVDYITIEYINNMVTVPAAGTTIEAEDFPFLNTYLQTTTTTTSTDADGNETTSEEVTESNGRMSVAPTAYEGASGDYILKHNYYYANTDTVSYSQTATWEQPITISEEGTYAIAYTLNQSHVHHASLSILLDGTTLELSPSSSSTPVLTTVTTVQKLTAGEHTIAVKAARQNNSNCTIGVDCVSILPYTDNTTPVEIGVDAVTVELENYVDNAYKTHGNIMYSGASVVEDSELYSGGKALCFEYQNNSLQGSVYTTFPINVTADGNYDISLISTGSENWRSSGIRLYIDDVQKLATSHTGYTTLATTEANDIALTAGTHNVKVEITNYSMNAHGTLDAVIFSNDVEHLSATKTVVLEAENYSIKNLNNEVWTDIESTIVSDSENGFSNNAYIDSNYSRDGGTNYLDITVYSPETRFYKITPKLKDIQHESGYSIYVDDNKLATLSSAGDAKDWFETSTYVELAEGMHKISILSKGNYSHRRLIADCITVSPESYSGATEVTISDKDITYIEAENYDTYKTVSNGLTVYGTVSEEYFVNYEGAHGTGDVNAIRWNAYGQEYVSFDIPIVVETSGYYEVDFNSGCSYSYTGTQELYLNDELFVESMKFSNAAADAFRSTIGHDKYLEAGSYTLTIKSTKTSANSNCYYYTDYVSFKPVSFIEESATAGTYDVTIIYEEPVSGIIAAAAYNKDNKIIALDKVDIADAERYTFQLAGVPTDEELRVIKLFAWDTECNPQDVRQDIFYYPVDSDPFEGDDEINIVYIGGSLTQGANSTFDGWVGLASDYFENKFGTDKVINHNVGIGGTTSQYGMFRLAQDVVNKNPDMIFIEFVLNDGGNNEASGASMETMVRTLLEMEKVPYINFVYTKYPGKNHIVPHYHTLIARHYGIPEIYVKGSYVDDETEETYYDDDDRVHPNDTGYTAWYAEIEKCLVSDKYYQKPIDKNTAVYEESGALMATALEKSEFTQNGAWTYDSTGDRLYSSTANDSVSFSFDGNSIAFIISGNSSYGKYNVSIDGVDKGTFTGTTVGWDQMGTFFTDLNDGSHDVTITLVERTATTAEDGTVSYDVPGNYFCIEEIFVGSLIG